MSITKNGLSDKDIIEIVERKQEESREVLINEIGDAYIKYRQKWEEAKKGKIFNYPIHLDFEISFGCNLRCGFCFYRLPLKKWNYKVEPRKKISLKKFSEIVKKGIDYDLNSIYLNGTNEPLLQNDVVKYINYAKKIGLTEISLHSNGLLLTENLSKSLIESGLTVIMFSVDASEEQIYRQIRHGGDFKKLITNINNFIELRERSKQKLPLVRLSFVLTKINYKNLPTFINYWQDKIDFFSLQFFYNPFVNRDNYEKIEDKFRLGSNPLSHCVESYQRLTIGNNGDVSPCCSFFGREMVVGNIYENSIYNIWNGDLMKNYRLSINNENFNKQPFVCRKCRISRLDYKTDNIPNIILSLSSLKEGVS